MAQDRSSPLLSAVWRCDISDASTVRYKIPPIAPSDAQMGIL